MKIGIVGYQGCGKSTLYEWLTGVAPDPALAHTAQSHMVPVPDDRIEALCEVYQPKKVTHAAINLIDTPGLNRTHEGSAAKLSTIREVGCLVVVVAAFDGSDPAADRNGFQDDLLIADLDIVARRIERLDEAVKKPRPDRDELKAEQAALQPLLAALEAGQSLDVIELSPEQEKATRSFQLFARKPRVVIFNTADDETDPDRVAAQAVGETGAVAVSLSLQLELFRMAEEERREFCHEMGVKIYDRGELIRKLMHASGQQLYFTAGDREVRSWMIPQGATAVEAADAIHSDLARGFIRAEVMRPEDLIRLGSEREVKAHNLMRQEPKDYVVQEGDVLFIRSGI